MSTVKVHGIRNLLTLEGDPLGDDVEVGSLVRYSLDPGSSGIVLESLENPGGKPVMFKVLWSSLNELRTWGEQLRNPTVVSYTQIAKDLFLIQPMPPGALTYYIDDLKTRTFSIKEEEE